MFNKNEHKDAELIPLYRQMAFPFNNSIQNLLMTSSGLAEGLLRNLAFAKAKNR